MPPSQKVCITVAGPKDGLRKPVAAVVDSANRLCTRPLPTTRPERGRARETACCRHHFVARECRSLPEDTVQDSPTGRVSPAFLGEACGARYVADAEAHMIFEVDEEGVRPVSGSGQVGFAESDGLSPATWDRPCALALDLHGDLLVRRRACAPWCVQDHPQGCSRMY